MEGRTRWGSLFFGICLMLLGGAFLMDRLGYLPPFSWMESWWTLIVMALGISHLLRPRSARSIGNGVMLILLGGWMLIANEGWYGLGWRHSWPLALVAMGAGAVAREIAANWLPNPTRKWREDHYA